MKSLSDQYNIIIGEIDGWYWYEW